MNPALAAERDESSQMATCPQGLNSALGFLPSAIYSELEAVSPSQALLAPKRSDVLEPRLAEVQFALDGSQQLVIDLVFIAQDDRRRAFECA